MPQAVTHFLIAAILVNLFRDYFIKNKKRFPLYLILIGGLAGLLPDFDVGAYWILHYMGLTLSEVHRTFTHTIFLPLLFLFGGFIFWAYKKDKARNISFVISFGIFIHLLLDMIVAGYIMPFYPVYIFKVGINLLQYIPEPFNQALLPSLDAVLLMIWMIYIAIRHKISSFI